LASQDPGQLSTFGSLAEIAIQGQYRTDPDFVEDSIYFGVDTSIGCRVGKNKALCPDILNYDQKHYMEIKPFTPNGRKDASESMGRYKTSLQPEYMPNTTWKAIPNIGNIIVADGTPIIYFNDEGVLFYTTRTHLYEAIIALSTITSLAKRRSALKKMREPGQPGLLLPEPSLAFQSPSLTTINAYLQQASIALIAAIAAAALLARYGHA
jgi:hypothetical protein